MPWIDPRAARKGDVVASPSNPLIRVVVDRVGRSTLAAAMPKHNPNLPGSTPVRVVIGTREGTDQAQKLVLDLDSRVWRDDPPDTTGRRRRGAGAAS
ncbi:hypothetical protein [Frankia sp. AgB32]|uniref:hypothetical protein n=1 Tax=Frankia sp. AgB32 TaxID=631119 RepID=UPI00200C2EEC|nr:hypothetical protein [Frankia sp. AgB32]MCK9898296.1 hypothetical protein [Frankia sp. AgB32]